MLSSLGSKALQVGRCFARLTRPLSSEIVHVTFIDRKGEKIEAEGLVGQNLVQVAHGNKIDVEAACECSLACSTCHVIVDPEFYDILPDPCEEEDDLLDLAPGLTETSRLGCQMILDKSLDGLVVTLPRVTRNFYVDASS